MNIKQILTELFTEEELQDNKPRHQRLLQLMMHIVVFVVLAVVMLVAYCEIGHDRDWPRAEAWNTRIHTHIHYLLENQ